MSVVTVAAPDDADMRSRRAATDLRWFGGAVGRPGCAGPPPDARLLPASRSSGLLWTAGRWPIDEVRTAVAGNRSVTIFGPCSAADDAVARLAARGVTDTVLTDFAGAYVVVESIPGGTTVLTDPGHVWPIYTATTPDGPVWGSSALALARLLGCRPDPAWLIVSVLAPERPDLLDGRSAFAGVVRRPPGTRLVLTADGVTESSAWEASDDRRGLEEGAITLRRALADAVAVRVGRSVRPTTDCSGGLDSSSLTLLAARALATPDVASAGVGGLDAVTVHPAGRTQGGDMDYAALVVATDPTIRHLQCALHENDLPYSRMTELVRPSDEPALSTVTMARAVAEFELLDKIGSDCHLTGDGGDTLLGCDHNYLADLVRDRRLFMVLREAVGWGRRTRSAVRPFLVDAFAAAAGRPRSGPRRHGQPDGSTAWATGDAWSTLIDAGANEARAPGGSVQRTVAAMQLVGRTARADVQVAEQYNVQVHNPFADVQVIEAATSVAAPLRCSPYGYKPLLVAAMDDLLPGPVAHRFTKGNFLAEHYLGLRHNLAALKDLAHGRLAAEGLVAPDRLDRLLEHAAAGLPVAFSKFEPLLAAEVWLRAVEEDHPLRYTAPTGGDRREQVAR